MQVEDTAHELGESDMSKPRVTHVLRDEQGQIKYLVVSKGLLFKKMILVPATRIKEVKQEYPKIESRQLHGFVQRPVVRPDRRHTFNQYVVRVPAAHRDPLVRHLKESGVGVDVYYPLCLHQQECFAQLGYAAGDFPAAEDAARTVLALPMFPEITEAQQDRVVGAIAGYLRQRLRLAA